jgi:2-polyprenyl-3-methyl-5-hydroxy-6-metoxy-1,4-benzoquinol methylase
VNSSLLELPFKENSFDIIICLEVLEHLKDDKKAVLNLSSCIKPGGYLIASVPSHFYFREYLDLMGHWRHYSSYSYGILFHRFVFKGKP